MAAAEDHQSPGDPLPAATSTSTPTPTTTTTTTVEELNLVTLNCWGLLHLSALRAPRLAQIGRELAAAQPPPHVVCLQECWTRGDYEEIRRATCTLLPHAKFYHSGAFGGGLAVLSRWPIEESSMLRYPLNGRPTAFFRGDWYVGKGVACATIRFGPGERDVLEVFNTHTHAPYEREPNDSYICHRTAQAWEMAKLLRGAARRGRLALALGDFNMLPLSLAHRVVTARAPVRDAWRVLHPRSSLGPARHPEEAARGRPVPGARANLDDNGATSDGLYNTWRWSKPRQKRLRAGEPCPVDPDAPDPLGKRLDYIFASTAFDPSSRSGWVVKSADVTMTARHPHLHVSLSDHFAVSATLVRHTLSPSPSSSSAGSADATADHDLSDFDAQLRLSAQQHPDAPDSLLPLDVYDEILAMICKYTARERGQRRWRGRHFYAAVAVWVGCLVAVWFSPANFVAFILVLVGSLGLAAGVVDGLLALLFFSWEINALKEFEWEVRNARAAASGELSLLDDDDGASNSDSKGNQP